MEYVTAEILDLAGNNIVCVCVCMCCDNTKIAKISLKSNNHLIVQKFTTEFILIH